MVLDEKRPSLNENTLCPTVLGLSGFLAHLVIQFWEKKNGHQEIFPYPQRKHSAKVGHHGKPKGQLAQTVSCSHTCHQGRFKADCPILPTSG